MLIAHVSTLFHPHPGGIETMVRSLATGMAARDGFDAAVVTRRTEGLDASTILDGVPVHRVGQPGGRWRERIRFLRDGRRTLAKIRPDVVHAHSLYTPALLATAATCPAVATLHTVGPTGNLADLLGKPSGRWRLRRYRKRLARVVALTDAMAAELDAAGFADRQIARIPNGVDERHFRLPSEDERAAARRRLGVENASHVVGFVGRLVHEKGADQLLRAWPELATRFAGGHLVVAGQGELADDLRRQSDEREAGARVHWFDDLEDQRQVYWAADLMVVPSRAESFGLVVLESMACGVPVLASRTGGIPEVAGDAAAWCNPIYPRDVAIPATALLEDADRRRDLARLGRSRVEDRFALSRVVDAHAAMYESVGAVG